MCATKGKQPTKAEKRWQRHLRELEQRRAEEHALWGTPDDGMDPAEEHALWRTPDDGMDPAEEDDTEDPALTKRFVDRVMGGDTFSPGAKIVKVEDIHGVKLSAAILEVCQPILDEARSDEHATRVALALGVAGWNIGCVPVGHDDALVDEVAGDLLPKGSAKKLRSSLVDAVRVIVNRKRELYPDFNFLVVEHEVVFDGEGGLQFNACGTMVAPHGAGTDEPAPRKGLLGRLRDRVARP